jgi:hypothetical protein
MPAPDRDPLAATGRLLVDGTNLLHAMSRSTGAAPPAALIGRLRGAIPGHIVIELVFDGPAEPGLRGERIASGVSVRYSGARTADVVILAIVDEVRKAGDATDTGALLVVTDDRDLRYEARLRGARTAGAKWLLGRLGSGRLASPSIGNPRPARPVAGSGSGAGTSGGGSGQSGAGHSGGQSGEDDRDAGRTGWNPGRGATAKRGNPKKAPRGSRAGRMPP